MHHLRTRAPARAKANLCGLTQTWPRAQLGPGNFLDRLVHGIRTRAESLGYTYDQLNLDDYPTSAQLQRVLVSRGIEGLLVLPLREPRDLSALLDWRLFSTVTVTSSVFAPRFHSVKPAHFDNIMLACRELTRAGFRRIGLAMSSEWDERVKHRWTGGIAWQNQFGGTAPVAPLVDRRPGPNLDLATLSAWLAREQPDAVVLETLDRSVLRQALATFPPRRRPTIVTMNWPNEAAGCGIDQEVERIGTVAAELVASMIARGEKGLHEQPATTVIDGTWVPGALRRTRPG
ncbi:MAG: LacI family DNA-binding transcriptional regulator [Verrucomicrobia bacterium]|nr:LacI family DNA-binding transcriptional regulator [Verrucomicrobiota bacterium]